VPFAIPRLEAGISALPVGLRVALAVVVYDLIAFVVHRRLHRVDALWAVHKVHHSSRHLDWLATTRTHMFEHMVRNLPAQGALLLAGFSVRMVTSAAVIYAGFALLGHSNLRLNLRWAEPIFITPRLHRRHHVPSTTNRNFGTVLSIWDRAARTFAPLDTPGNEPLGVPGELDTYPQRFVEAVRAPGRELRARRRREPVEAC
jgi:sterol desaturase/sphingolipid hydroxylase (fatty acid hydroxylase superfamily)